MLIYEELYLGIRTIDGMQALARVPQAVRREVDA
jgi:hypothetical protein